MDELTIECPNCKTKIKLTESLAAPLVAQVKADSQKQLEDARKQNEKVLNDVNAKMAQREALIKSEREKLSAEKADLEETTLRLAEQQRKKIADEEARKAHLAVEMEMEQKAKEIQQYEERMKTQNAKLAEAQKAQAELVQKQRELDEARREMELTIQKRISASLGQEREKAQQEIREAMSLQKAESEEKIKSMQRMIDELKQKSEQGSQQLQGEAQEIELETILRQRFGHDTIEPVPKGEFGGDIIHNVLTPQGQRCGTILWESKRTKNWSAAWLPKLRSDMRSAKADHAVLVSHVLPEDVHNFSLVDGIWVTSVACAIPVAMVLRQSMVNLQLAKLAGEGQQTKMDMVYEYLTGPEFRHRVEAVVETFRALHEDLQAEKKAMQKQWAKREKQIEIVSGAMSGMYGDLQGIAGKQLKEIQGLDIKSLGAGE